MKKQNLFLTVILGAVVLIIVAIVIQLSLSVNTPSITIPSPLPSLEPGGPDGGDNLLEVTPATVQAFVASIERPDSYSQKYTVTRYWNGGEASAEVTAFHKSGQFRMIYSQNDRVKNTLIADGKVYYWYDGSSAVTSVGLADESASALDQYASLVVYEDLLKVSQKDIWAVSQVFDYGENCIYVEYKASDEYIHKLHISVEKGLLVAAEVLENGKTVYLMQPEYTDLTAPGDDMFILP